MHTAINDDEVMIYDLQQYNHRLEVLLAVNQFCCRVNFSS